MIYIDTSVALAHLLAEDRQPPGSLWEETLFSSRLLEYEIWTPLHARGLAEACGEAVLEVDFRDATAPGTVEGSISGFILEGQAKDWSVALETAAIGTHGTIFLGGVNTAFTRWTIGGVEAEPVATWRGQFHEADLDSTPSVATGRFDAAHGDTARISGAFGTVRQ